MQCTRAIRCERLSEIIYWLLVYPHDRGCCCCCDDNYTSNYIVQLPSAQVQCMNESHPITPANAASIGHSTHIVSAIGCECLARGKQSPNTHSTHTLWTRKRNQFSLNNFNELHSAVRAEPSRCMHFSSSSYSFLWMDERRAKFDTFQLFGNLNAPRRRCRPADDRAMRVSLSLRIILLCCWPATATAAAVVHRRISRTD